MNTVNDCVIDRVEALPLPAKTWAEAPSNALERFDAFFSQGGLAPTNCTQVRPHGALTPTLTLYVGPGRMEQRA